MFDNGTSWGDDERQTANIAGPSVEVQVTTQSVPVVLVSKTRGFTFYSRGILNALKYKDWLLFYAHIEYKRSVLGFKKIKTSPWVLILNKHYVMLCNAMLCYALLWYKGLIESKETLVTTLLHKYLNLPISTGLETKIMSHKGSWYWVL